MPKKYVVVKFTSLPDPMCGIRWNKETFSMDVTQFTHTGVKHWGLVFYDVNYKLLAYYRLGFQDPTDSSILDVLGQFIADNGIRRPLITDSHSILGAGKKQKQIPGRKSILLFLSEPDKHNKTPIECSIQNLKARVGKIGNDFKTGLL